MSRQLPAKRIWVRTRGLKCLTSGSILLLVWWYSGAIGHFLGMPGVDLAHYPYDLTHYPEIRVHWPLQMLLPLGATLLVGGLLLSLIDFVRAKRREIND